MAAARWWARGGKPAAAKPSAGASKVAADLAAFGAPRELVGRWSALSVGSEGEVGGADLFLVRPDCWKAVRLFCALETQWAWVSVGFAGVSRTGLRYEVVEPVGRLSRIAVTPDLFADLRSMESAALDELAVIARDENERRQRDRPAGKRKRGK